MFILSSVEDQVLHECHQIYNNTSHFDLSASYQLPPLPINFHKYVNMTFKYTLATRKSMS